MDEAAFLRRTKAFALGVLKLSDSIPTSDAGRVLGRQLFRSGTSVGANYRAACRAKSKADMINKLRIVEEELDESLFWMELLIEGKFLEHQALKPLVTESKELLAMTVASRRTLAKSLERPQSKIENRKPEIPTP